jgi:hypothetical protein
MCLNWTNGLYMIVMETIICLANFLTRYMQPKKIEIKEFGELN